MTELTYAAPNWQGTPGFSAENLFYPTDVVAVRLRFGGRWDSAKGRIGLDDVEITR